ncbi:hypothetical protein TYRP_000491 [Tyrophagus putrescentiae]|nr:hypothetical protein TYRP_000491 [Tyrophagus putrescentiae]
MAGAVKPPVRPVHLCRLSASLIADSHLFVFDTEGGKRLTQFCAISASPSQSLSKSECLNLYNLETHRLQAQNFTKKLSSVPSFGNWLPFQLLLTTINEYFRRSQKGVILIGHSAISADSAHLTLGLLQHFQQRRLDASAVPHGNIVGYIDTLPLFRWLYPNLSSYKQTDLVRHFLGVKYNAHNALDDSLMLFSLWLKFIWPLAKNNLELLGRASVSNIYCVDRYLAKKSSFSLKSYFETLVRSKLPVPLIRSKPQIKLYHTKLLLNHLYPVLDAL